MSNILRNTLLILSVLLILIPHVVNYFLHQNLKKKIIQKDEVIKELYLKIDLYKDSLIRCKSVDNSVDIKIYQSKKIKF